MSDVFIHKHTGTVTLYTEKACRWVQDNHDFITNRVSKRKEVTFPINPDSAEDFVTAMTEAGLEVESK